MVEVLDKISKLKSVCASNIGAKLSISDAIIENLFVLVSASLNYAFIHLCLERCKY